MAIATEELDALQEGRGRRKRKQRERRRREEKKKRKGGREEGKEVGKEEDEEGERVCFNQHPNTQPTYMVTHKLRNMR